MHFTSRSRLQHRRSQALFRIAREDVVGALLDIVGSVRHYVSIFVHSHVHEGFYLLASTTLDVLPNFMIEVLHQSFVSMSPLYVKGLCGLRLLYRASRSKLSPAGHRAENAKLLSPLLNDGVG